jgi:hypothetical protein
MAAPPDPGLSDHAPSGACCLLQAAAGGKKLPTVTILRGLYLVRCTLCRLPCHAE